MEWLNGRDYSAWRSPGGAVSLGEGPLQRLAASLSVCEGQMQNPGWERKHSLTLLGTKMVVEDIWAAS